MTPPSHADLPARPRPTATLHYGRANGDRRTLVLEAGGSRELDQLVIARIDDLRSAGNQMVKTVMMIDGQEWVYEYNSVGQVEHLFLNGDVTP